MYPHFHRPPVAEQHQAIIGIRKVASRQVGSQPANKRAADDVRRVMGVDRDHALYAHRDREGIEPGGMVQFCVGRDQREGECRVAGGERGRRLAEAGDHPADAEGRMRGIEGLEHERVAVRPGGAIAPDSVFQPECDQCDVGGGGEGDG